MANEDERGRGRKVHVTAEYPSTAKDTRFVAEQERTVGEVISEAYERLGESPRAGDRHFCGEQSPVDLAPYRSNTLAQLVEQGVCLLDGRGKLEMHLEIEIDPGGASGWTSHP